MPSSSKKNSAHRKAKKNKRTDEGEPLGNKSTKSSEPSQASTSRHFILETGASTSPQPTSDVEPKLIFSNSKDFHVGVFNYVENRMAGIAPTHDSLWGKGWEILVEEAVPSALHNSRDRFDSPKCDEDTRTEVNAEIMNWIQDREAPKSLLCMTGAAGAGKSAIFQTIAEHCARLEILAATFFFSSADRSRNAAKPFVATIACQLALLSPILRASMVEEVEKDPLLFAKSLQVQLDTLIVKPIRRHHISFSNIDSTFPYAIIIDGLDECKDERQQAQLLLAIDKCLVSNSDLPFRILLASRPELPIYSALGKVGHLHPLAYHIPISNTYDASADIRRYLWRRLRDIGLRSGDARAHAEDWPGEAIIELLVRSASGQFVYAATVIKYVSEPRCSPVDRLGAVVAWTPGATQRTKPFAALDALYRQILMTARDNYRSIDGNEDSNLVLLLRIAAHTELMCSFVIQDRPEVLGLSPGSFGELICDVRALVTESYTNYGDNAVTVPRIRFYHKSCEDFLRDADRGGDLYVSDQQVCLQFARLLLMRIESGANESAISAARRKGDGVRPKGRSSDCHGWISGVWCLPRIIPVVFSFGSSYRSEAIALILRWIDLRPFAELWYLNSVASILKILTEIKEEQLVDTILTGYRPAIMTPETAQLKFSPNPLANFGEKWYPDLKDNHEWRDKVRLIQQARAAEDSAA